MGATLRTGRSRSGIFRSRAMKKSSRGLSRSVTAKPQYSRWLGASGELALETLPDWPPITRQLKSVYQLKDVGDLVGLPMLQSRSMFPRFVVGGFQLPVEGSCVS